jgi:hypothetical protein
MPMIKALRREITIVAVVFLVGMVVGWLLLGWVIAPVVWTDGAPIDLQQSYRSFYLRTLAIAYASGAVTPDDLRLLGKGERWTTDQMLAEVNQLAAGPNGGIYQNLINGLNQLKAQEGTTATSAPPAAAGGVSPLAIVGVVVVVGAVVFLSIQVARRGRGGAPATPGAPRAATRAQAGKAAAPPAVWAGETEAPLREFTMTYALGDDRFDMSNAIETGGGMFLGECGMGISETIGVGDPSKVTAFEVWLFDKNDIRTVTSVLMSDHAFKDPTLKTKLAAKGDAVLAQPNALITLETAALRVRAIVTELEYGGGQLPDRSFFQRLQVVMAAWPVGDSDATQPGALVN